MQISSLNSNGAVPIAGSASTAPKATSETSIQYNTIRENTERDAVIKRLEEIYAPIAARNKSLGLTDKELDRLIYAKYFFASDPNYIDGNFNSCDRLSMYTNEMHMTLYGNIKQGTAFADPRLEGKFPVSDAVMTESKKLYNRQIVNGQINSLFAKHGIQIPSNLRLAFTIEPNTFKLTVSGTDDKELISMVELVLNEGDNASELYKHIFKSSGYPEETSKYTRAQYEKYQVVSQIKRYTGYVLKDLELSNGKFLTPDGKDVFEVFKEAIRNDEYYKNDPVATGAMFRLYGEWYKNLAENGFDYVPDMVLTIDWQNGSLYDVGQSKQYGTGQTDWLQDLIAEKGMGWFYDKKA